MPASGLGVWGWFRAGDHLLLSDKSWESWRSNERQSWSARPGDCRSGGSGPGPFRVGGAGEARLRAGAGSSSPSSSLADQSRVRNVLSMCRTDLLLMARSKDARVRALAEGYYAMLMMRQSPDAATFRTKRCTSPWQPINQSSGDSPGATGRFQMTRG